MRKIIHQFFVLVLVVSSILLLTDVVKACSCAGELTMDLAETAPNIVVLKLQEVDENAKDESGKEREISKLLVTKVYKGNLKVGEIINHKATWFCSWSFDKKEIGTEYLFYLDKPDEKGFWNGFICTRSAPLKMAGDDLLYLEKMDKVRGKTRISGVLVQENRPSLENEEIQRNLLTDRKIQIVGTRKRVEVTTDKNGAYEVYDLSAGIYEIIPQKVNGFKIYERGKSIDSVKVYLPPKRHAQVNIEFTIFNSISGKIVDDMGNPMESVGLNLKPATGESSIYFYQAAYSKKDGSFTFYRIPTGKYLLIANDNGKITADEPFIASFYPNTTKIEEAKIISIGAGEHLKDLKIIVVPIVKVVTVRGVIQYADGKPVADESVEFFKDVKSVSEIKNNVFADSKEKSDKNGQFTFRMLEGEKGILYGSIYKGDLKGCSNLEKANTTNQRVFGLDFEYFNTNLVSINADKNLDGITLKFQFPSCKKIKTD